MLQIAQLVRNIRIVFSYAKMGHYRHRTRIMYIHLGINNITTIIVTTWYYIYNIIYYLCIPNTHLYKYIISDGVCIYIYKMRLWNRRHGTKLSRAIEPGSRRFYICVGITVR